MGSIGKLIKTIKLARKLATIKGRVIDPIMRKISTEAIRNHIQFYATHPGKLAVKAIKSPFTPALVGIGALRAARRTKLGRIALGGFPAELGRSTGIAAMAPMIAGAPLLPSIVALGLAAKGGHMVGRAIERVTGRHEIPPKLAKKLLRFTGE